ncbi:type II secretion system protein GspG [Nonomuraea sp. ATR24]|uniref:type II secretion system protein GspG n=1 Tax=Nonomuraea TaxID=83681 RepID=UPI001C5DAC51|nr:type II secretion system protein GspG [Nonomuraea ceibae]
MELSNSKRILRSANYTQIKLSATEFAEEDRRPGRALEKLNFIDQIPLTPDELEAGVEKLMRQEDEAQQRQDAGEGYDRSHLQQVVNVKRELSRASLAPDVFSRMAPTAAAIPISALLAVARSAVSGDLGGGGSLQIDAFEQTFKVAPVGRLHLERIEMYPAGIERGELMFTIPLAPKETITVSHKEWSTTGEEYENIVQDFFESYSERGVAEKTDASLSAENESKHASAFNFQAVASGSYGPVSMTVTTGLTSTSDNREALKTSTQRSREVTEKASSRSRQEHKISLKLEKKSGVEDSSFRTITNPSDTKALRIDFYRMMRKWRTDLFRYGLRLTFDIMVPNPGARLWALYRQVRELDAQIRKPFVFPLTLDQLTDANWSAEATKWSAAVDPPPPAKTALSDSRKLHNPDPPDPGVNLEVFEFIAPDGYTVGSEVAGTGSWTGEHDNPAMQIPPPVVMQVTPGSFPHSGTFLFTSEARGGSKKKVLEILYLPSELIHLTVRAGANRTPEAFASWRQQAWSAMRDAAFNAYREEIARLQEQRDRLWADLTSKDTLTLRRLEREELIRQVITWLLGPDYRVSPAKTSVLLKKIVGDEQKDLPDDQTGGADQHQLTPADWANLKEMGDVVKFVHHAVEWENLLYFLYPYFWGSDDLAREKMLFEHPDVNHRDFLRSGYARIVIPVRPGFEEQFTKLIDSGSLGGTGSTPYLPIAQEIANHARTNYMGIPPANPETHARPLLLPQQRKTWATMEQVILKLEEFYKANGSYPSALSSLSGGPFIDAWGKALKYTMPGSSNDYDLFSFGADGDEGGTGADADISAGAAASLVGTWYDYTPTSGIDIELNSKLDTTA